MEDRPFYKEGLLSVMVSERMLLQFRIVDGECEEGEGVLRRIRQHFIQSEGQSCGWTECRQQLIDEECINE